MRGEGLGAAESRKGWGQCWWLTWGQAIGLEWVGGRQLELGRGGKRIGEGCAGWNRRGGTNSYLFFSFAISSDDGVIL